MKIHLVGIETISDNSPTVNDLARPAFMMSVVTPTIPAVNPKPTCSLGLKNIFSFLLDSKSPIFGVSMVKNCGI